MTKTIQVRVYGKDYALRVDEEDEALTRSIATHVDERMRAFRDAHPDQPEVTVAVVTALGISEQYFVARERYKARDEARDEEIESLSGLLEEAIEG